VDILSIQELLGGNKMDRKMVDIRLKKVLKENQFLALKNMVDTITDKTSLVNDLALDSIQILELVVGIEKEFGFFCEPDELELDMFDNYGKLVDFVQNKLNTQIEELIYKNK
jgi:acyl carrier protein